MSLCVFVLAMCAMMEHSHRYIPRYHHHSGRVGQQKVWGLRKTYQVAPRIPISISMACRLGIVWFLAIRVDVYTNILRSFLPLLTLGPGTLIFGLEFVAAGAELGDGLLGQ